MDDPFVIGSEVPMVWLAFAGAAHDVVTPSPGVPVPRIAARKASYLLAVVVCVAVIVFAIRGRQYDIVATMLAGILLTQLILWIVRVRRIHAPAGSLVPAGLDHASGSRRRQRVVPAELPPPPGLLIGRDAVTEWLHAKLSQPS